jgi:hypothetical protein
LLYCSIIAYDTVASLNIAPPPPPLCPPLCAGGRPCIERSIGSAIYWVWILLNSRAFFFSPWEKRKKALLFSSVDSAIYWVESLMHVTVFSVWCLSRVLRTRALSLVGTLSLVVAGSSVGCRHVVLGGGGYYLFFYFFIR